MNAQDIQRMIDQTEYWDVNILDFKTAFFGDEAFLYIYNDATSCWKVCFSSCYEVKYRTDADRRKIPFVKNMEKPQLGYYGQDITVTNADVVGFYKITMDMSIMNLEITCKHVEVEKVKLSSVDLFWMDS